MFTAICLFIPAILFMTVRNNLLKTEYSKEKRFVEYLLAVLFINYISILVSTIVASSDIFVLLRIQQSNKFAICYLSLSTILAVVIPLIEKIAKKYVKIEIKNLEIKSCKKRNDILIWFYAFVLFFFNFIRCFDNTFWGDECYSIKLAKMTVQDMIQATAVDVHPPLYYLILQLFYHILGNNGFTYHIASLIPYGIMMVFALTVVKKEFGKPTTLVFITLASVLSNALTYNVEARMYSWAGLFVLLSFFCLYKILTETKKANWFLFMFFSLAAAYTHYYALVSVAFFYMFLFVFILWKRREYIARVLVVCLGTIAGYLPWLFIFVNTFKRTTNNFWLGTIPTLKECVGFLFSSPKSAWILFTFILCMGAFILYETGKLCIDVREHKKYVVKIDLGKNEVNNRLLWILAGILSVIGTIIVGEGISFIVRPMFIVRYLFPVATVMWLAFAVCFSSFRWRKVEAILVTAMILCTCIPSCLATYQSEKTSYNSTSECVEMVREELFNDDMILTSNSHLDWTILDYYFPDNGHALLSSEELLSQDKFADVEWAQYDWFFHSTELTEEQIQILNQEALTVREVFKGSLGTNPVVVYKLEQKKE